MTQSSDNWLVHDHSMYETLLAQCADAVDMEDWKAAKTAFQEMIWHLKGHMAMEEEVLYPAYDSRIRLPHGPTQALIEEHDSIVRHAADLVRVMQSRDADLVLDCLSHMEKLMIKHHEKEEDIFLPMAGLLLEQDREQILEQLHQFDPQKTKRKWPI